MDKTAALAALSALGQETRLDVMRLLIVAGRDGMAAGEIAAALDVRQNTMSATLAVLTQAGLLRSQRSGRSIRYFAAMDGLRALVEYLVRDCCGGRPETCQPLLDEIAGCCA